MTVLISGVRGQKHSQSLTALSAISGEAGADAGALRREFFEDALNEADNRLFEGEVNNRVPKKDFGLQMDYKWSLRLQECCLVTPSFRMDPVWPVLAI